LLATAPYSFPTIRKNEHIDERVKLSVFAARIDPQRQFREQSFIKFPATNSGARHLGSTQVSLTRKPDLIMQRASAGVDIPHTGKIGCKPGISRRMTFVYEMSLISGEVYDDNPSQYIKDELRAATST
jgi:hypothetical protein